MIVDHPRMSMRLSMSSWEHHIVSSLEHIFPIPPNPISRLDIEQFEILKPSSRFPVSTSKMQAVVRNLISRVYHITSLACCAFAIQKKVQAVCVRVSCDLMRKGTLHY